MSDGPSTPAGRQKPQNLNIPTPKDRKLKNPGENKAGAQPPSPTVGPNPKRRRGHDAVVSNIIPGASVEDELAAWRQHELPGLEKEREERVARIAPKNFHPEMQQYGIQVVDMPLKNENKPKTAGYLNLTNVTQLAHLWSFHDKALREFYEEMINDFGIEKPREKGRFLEGRQFLPGVFFGHLKTRGKLTLEQVSGCGPLNKDHFPIDNHRNPFRMYGYYARFVSRVLADHEQGAPDALLKKRYLLQPVFTGSGVTDLPDTAKPPLVWDRYHPEDVFRALHLLRCLTGIWRKKNKGYLLPTVNNAKLVLPVFTFLDSSRGNTETQAAGQGNAEHSIHSSRRTHSPRKVPASPKPVDDDDTNMLSDEDPDTLQKQLEITDEAARAISEKKQGD